MDELLQKYFDGELSVTEAAELAKTLARNPELELELRKIERALDPVANGAARGLSPGFSDEVMRRVGGAAASGRPHAARERGRTRVWSMRLAWAAVCVLAFVIGRAGQHESPTAGAGGTAIAPVAEARSAGASFRLARLVYVPRHAGVERVSVAGTFNDWDPNTTTMKKVGDVWVITITLPPAAYEYMFVEDGQRWVTDPLAAETRDDGFGRRNAVLDLTI